MGVSLCYLKVPCAALTRAHGDGTSLVQSSLLGEPQFPSLVLQQPSSPRKKSRITEVLGLNTALTESETSIRAIYLLTNLREKKKKLPQDGCCSSQMGSGTCFSCTCAFLAGTCVKEPLCAGLQLPGAALPPPVALEAPAGRWSWTGRAAAGARQQPLFSCEIKELRIRQKRLEKTLLIYSDFTTSRFLQPQLAQ